MSKVKTKNKNKISKEQENVEQIVQYEKKIYDLEQLLEIAKSFCQNLDLGNLIESIVYICMAQMHVLGVEIFIGDLVTNGDFILKTDKDAVSENKVVIPFSTPITTKLLDIKKPVTFEELKNSVGECKYLEIIEKRSPTLIVPLILQNHLNGILILQERIAIEGDISYTEYEQNQIMYIASLASVAINNAALTEIASLDMMTHLKLKYYFFDYLLKAIDSAFLKDENIAVLMFDIDFFKKLNDTYGHECGDFVLITVANIIKKSLRDADVASRYGGEEFTVLLNNTAKDGAMLVAERIRSSIESYDFVYNESHFHVTISVGVSVFDAKTNLVNSPNHFVNQADQALYMSKRNGRNRVTYFEHEGQ